jgi:hypothetical protein
METDNKYFYKFSEAGIKMRNKKLWQEVINHIDLDYADKNWSNGEVYKNLGFKVLSESRPDYKYIVENKRVHKSNFKKSNIGITNEMTENEWTKIKGILRIFDCGKIKFIKKI